MTEKRRRTPADYEAAAADYERHPPTADEIRSIEFGPGLLRMGRPRKADAAAGKSGKTPAMALRLPDETRTELKARVDEDHEAASESELVRVAIHEYFQRHPRPGRGGPRFPGFPGKVISVTDAPREVAELTAKIVGAFEHQSHRQGFDFTVKPHMVGAGEATVVFLDAEGGLININIEEFAADLTEVRPR
ncbi:hypothetical protein [Mycolicibacterium mucogenicum]|uniref:Uncharacterized protein n=1 Tax=Mycolicibacterium mucogenicum DSM 44124 TaxID=1226753 RepID=A0A8E4W380_MYCMU|nr:hypothetical protein [Mycolicibacterium mucogenicum]KAB7761194.1 hypothetical protein MMUC44124_00945 [Mycolicibacterium mucogenicum DSM 44124]QPG69998.1 hypothetical protein C1S78_002930 [Mycolicibacterium mucogenicum DSM 44124]